MDIWLFVLICTWILTLLIAVMGVIRSSEKTLGIVANLSLATFGLSIIAAFGLPDYPGISWQEVVALSIVVAIATVTVRSNVRHNDVIVNKLKDKTSKWTH